MRSGERGAILVDYFIALFFFMATLGTFFELTAVKVRAMGEGDRRMRAIRAAESRLAEFRAGAAAIGPFAAPGGPDLAGDLRVRARPDGLEEVAVTVTWREPRAGTDERVEIVTLSSGKR